MKEYYRASRLEHIFRSSQTVREFDDLHDGWLMTMITPPAGAIYWTPKHGGWTAGGPPDEDGWYIRSSGKLLFWLYEENDRLVMMYFEDNDYIDKF